jgi:hypothetical protein
LSAVVFDTGLDAESTAPAGRVYWRPVRMAGGTAIVPLPSGSGFVSLRANMTDTAGNAVEQTIIRAYRFG